MSNDFHFPNEVEWTYYFRFDKLWIKNLNWARISSAAKTVLPVIAWHCNEHGKAFPGEERIAALSGLTVKSVRKGIIDLKDFPGFEWSYYRTCHGKRGKQYFIEFPPKYEKGRAFSLYRGIMDGGIWHELKPSAQALYPVLRYLSRYDVDKDGVEEDLSKFKESFAERRWELCCARIGQLAHLTGISRRSIADAMLSLQENFLVETHVDSNGKKAWKVFLIPDRVLSPHYLNQSLKKTDPLFLGK